MKNNSISNTDIPLSEKVRSLPGFFGIHLEEQAPYEVIKTDDGVEIRCYGPQTHAKITVSFFCCLFLHLFISFSDWICATH